MGGRTLAAPLVAGEEEPGRRSAIFSELTYHAAYEPQRAIRTERFKYIRGSRLPLSGAAQLRRQPEQGRLPRARLGDPPVARESLHDLFFNPGEGRNDIDDDDYADVLGRPAGTPQGVDGSD